MNRNVESHFSELPSINIQRSIFDRSCGHMTSFNAGDLIPIYVDEVLPGDSVKMTTSKVIRAQTLLTPTFGNIYLDVYWFFIGLDTVWDHAFEFFGENKESAWIQQNQYQIPSISAPSGGFATGTIADYLGLPVGVDWDNTAAQRPSALPFRAYAKICDCFFRDQNLTDPLNIPMGDSNQTGTNGSSYINDVANGGMPFKVAKYHDYFTSCLPNSQKASQAVSFDLLNDNKAPVITGVSRNVPSGAVGFNLKPTDGSTLSSNYDIGISSSGTVTSFSTPSVSSSQKTLYPTNLYADLSTSLGSITVNELRLAFTLQQFYEKMARSGSRYVEVIASHFSIFDNNVDHTRPEYLGGNRIPIQIHEVTNSAQSTQDFLGDLGAKSVTSDIHEDFEHSFSRHGILMAVACIRYDHTYSQGLEKFWTRRKFDQFYWPVFANLGESPVYDSEIYADATTMANDSVFGFQEAWSDYRYKPDRCSGEMRPGIANSLASWNLADYYTQKPTLSDGWIREDKTNVDRTLAVTSANANQFFADFYFKSIWTRPMPMYSIPGIDRM